MLCLVLLVAVQVAAAEATTRPATVPAIADADVVPLATAATHVAVIPHDLVTRDGRVDVFVQLKGSPQRAHAAMKDAGVSAIVIVVTDPGLSRAYAAPFADPGLLQRMIDQALDAARQRGRIPPRTQLGSLCLGSFSAGYAAVRELLKHERWFEAIDGICFQDSIYAGYVSDTDRRPQPEQMRDFRRFAAAAARGEKVMIVTHTRLVPGTYASTAETADDLLEAVSLEATTFDPPKPLGDDLLVYREARAGSLWVVGTTGDDGAEHGRHLANLRLFLGPLPLARRDAP
jgi:hypothetical protein